MAEITFAENNHKTKVIADEEWDLVIPPKAQFLDFNLKEWHLIQPIFTTIMFLLVFGKIANISTDSVPPVLFYMSGITIWNYFASCLNSTSNTFMANAGIFGKVYFPRLVIPLSNVII